MSATGSAPGALDRLATALGPEFATTLVSRPGRRPRLTVTDRSTLAAGDVYADDRGQFWWVWAEPVAATDDPLAAAHQVTATLRGVAAGGQR